MDNINDNQLLTEPQVARLINVGHNTLRDWRRAGKITFLRFGRTVRFRPSDIQQLLAQSVQEARK